MNNIKVSVLCITYNQEEYISKVLDGFVNQKVNFEFEILINDDASTDNTALIIKEYEKKYPGLIKPIYQKENQYSKGVSNFFDTILVPRAKGEYLAWCEGDDFWTDMNKLQTQVDFLDKHPDYSMCVCQGVNRYYKTGMDSVVPLINEDKDYTTEEIIKGEGEIFLVCTLMMRRNVYLQYPVSFSAKDFADYQMYIFGSSKGKCRCISKIMAVRNAGIPGSWSERIWNNPEERIKHLERRIGSLTTMRNYYYPDFSDSFLFEIQKSEFLVLLLKHEYKKAKKEPYSVFWKANKAKYRKQEFLHKFPWVLKIKHLFSKRKK